MFEQIDAHRLRRDFIIADRLESSSVGGVDQKDDQRDAQPRENDRKQRRFVGREITQNIGTVCHRAQGIPLKKCS